jgi:hypothetical protein
MGSDEIYAVGWDGEATNMTSVATRIPGNSAYGRRSSMEVIQPASKRHTDAYSRAFAILDILLLLDVAEEIWLPPDDGGYRPVPLVES